MPADRRPAGDGAALSLRPPRKVPYEAIAKTFCPGCPEVVWTADADGMRGRLYDLEPAGADRWLLLPHHCGRSRWGRPRRPEEGEGDCRGR